MIEIHNLQKSYGDINILKNIDLTIDDGEIYGLVGRSGAGKSTLLRCINGLEKYNFGSLKVNGFDIKEHSDEEIRHFRKNIGMIFQHFSLMERKTVYQNVALPMECWNYPKAEIDKRVKELLKIVDIEDKIHEKPRSLSGGQKQRVAIARALSLNPKILLCDEATSALDPKTTQSILLLLRKINETLGIAIVFVTHQMSIVRQFCHKVCILENGEIMAKGVVSDIFSNQPQALKNLLGEEEEEVLPSHGINIKITYSEANVNDRVLSDMAQKLDIGFSLVWAKTEQYSDRVLGWVILNVDEENVPIVGKYLDDVSARWEVLYNEQ